ncbi:hypothetical protein [Cognatiluteimonas profundi]|uniref:hypothetical protein n=1 Tax=Cognatiluteimonas profundi TaxID=2594501 RepID=UPI00131E71F5|nr:hypothetical protein [Lysobacter profundi]
MSFAPLAASIQSTIDPVATQSHALRDVLAAPIQARVQAMTTPLQRGRTARVAVPRLAGGALVQPGLDAVATMVEPTLDDRGATVEAMLDAIAPPVEALLDTIGVGGRHSGTGRQEEQGASQRQGQDRSHGKISVCRIGPAGRRTSWDATG